MPLYENSVIYKLVHKNDQDNENIYVGSTTNFRGRKVKHREKYYDKNTKEYNYKVYQFIRENGGWDEWEMVAVETYPCESKRELEIRERFHIETLKSKLNKIVPTRTSKEYREDNKELIKEKKKKEYEDNKEHIKERSLKNYYAKQEENKERNKQYRENNREKLSQHRQEKVSCECGCILSRNHLNRHCNTDKHKKKMEELNK
jgi:hypothetical protein